MKTLLLITALVMSVSANAARTKSICKEQKTFEKQTLILTQVADRDLKEGVKERFVLEIFKGYETEPRLSTKGYVTTEDVSFDFESDNKQVSVSLYLDELDQTTLTENHKDTHFDCY